MGQIDQKFDQNKKFYYVKNQTLSIDKKSSRGPFDREVCEKHFLI